MVRTHPGRRNWRVLVIEDDRVTQKIVVAACRRVLPGARVCCVRSLADGVDSARGTADRFDLVLLDLWLPDSTGIETLRRFRARASVVPILIVSADESRAGMLQAFEAGATGYVPKTCPAGVIQDAVRAVARGRLFVPPQLRTGAAG